MIETLQAFATALFGPVVLWVFAAALIGFVLLLIASVVRGRVFS